MDEDTTMTSDIADSGDDSKAEAKFEMGYLGMIDTGDNDGEVEFSEEEAPNYEDYAEVDSAKSLESAAGKPKKANAATDDEAKAASPYRDEALDAYEKFMRTDGEVED